MKMFFRLFIILIVFTVFCQCRYKKIERILYIDDLNLYIRIEEMEKLNEKAYLFRVYLNDSIDQKSEDYIDLSYVPSEMPSITMVFQQDDSRNIYIIDYYHEVIKSNSAKFNMVYHEFNRNELKEISTYWEWCDSVRSDKNSIRVQLSSYLSGVVVWTGDEIIGKDIEPYDKSI